MLAFKILNAYTLTLKHILNISNTIACPYKFSRSINSTKVPADLAYEGFIAKCAWLSKVR